MNLSVGILYSARELILFVRSCAIKKDDVTHQFKSFLVAQTGPVVEVAQDCRWIGIGKAGEIIITRGGERLANCLKPELALRLQLRDFIATYHPAWSHLLVRGREEALKLLPSDIVQCFREAGLLDTWNDDILAWWDEIAGQARIDPGNAKNETGRKGEKLSLAFERTRTGREPTWVALDSSLCGYDIESTVSMRDDDLLHIEVKSTEMDISLASFHVTRNEWRVAEASKRYVFHLWQLAARTRLYIIKRDAIGSNIPDNNGDGSWESVEIPFLSVIGKPAYEVKDISC